MQPDDQNLQITLWAPRIMQPDDQNLQILSFRKARRAYPESRNTKKALDTG